MPKVRVVWTTDGEEWNAPNLVIDGLPWDEVTEQELALLRSNLHRIPHRDYLRPVLLVAEPEGTKTSIASIREFLAVEKARIEAERQKAQERKARKALKDIEDKKALLKRLQDELGKGYD